MRGGYGGKIGWADNPQEDAPEGGPTTIQTADGYIVGPGDRVWTHYDRQWGVIGRPAFDGWFEFTPEGANLSLIHI